MVIYRLLSFYRKLGMNISDIRIENLAKVIGDPDKHGAVAAFAKKHDLDPTYIRQLLGGHRNMGEKAARNFEEKLGLDKGYLDQTDMQSPKVSARFSEAAHQARGLPVEDQEFLAAVIEQYLSKKNTPNNQ
jgi:hypothetical protein